MRRIIPILLMFFVAFSAACHTKLPEDGSAAGSGAMGLIDADVTKGSIQDLEDDEINSVANEILGAMILRELSIQALSSMGGEGPKAVSVEFDGNVGFDATVEEFEREFSIEGQEGHATIVAQGWMEEIISDGASGPVYYFSPLDMDISLDSYKFDAPDLGEMKVGGQIYCTFNGRYAEPTDKLIGYGSCNTGTAEEVTDIVLIYDGSAHIINHSVDYKVYGQPFDILSYDFSGEFLLDGSTIDP